MSSIGTALVHAHKNELAVEVLVEGHWLAGHVVLVDGFGVVLDRADNGQSVVRIESIAAVTVASEEPQPSTLAVAAGVARVAPQRIAAVR